MATPLATSRKTSCRARSLRASALAAGLGPALASYGGSGKDSELRPQPAVGADVGASLIVQTSCEEAECRQSFTTDTDGADTPLALPYETEIHWARRLGSAAA